MEAGPHGDLERLVRVGEALIDEAKKLTKAADAAMLASEIIAMEARETRAAIARRRAADCPAAEWRITRARRGAEAGDVPPAAA